MDYLVIPFLLVLAISTAFYLWLANLKKSKIPKNKLVIGERDFLQWPSLQSIMAEMSMLIKEFFTVAFPIFIVICLLAGMLDWLGVIKALSWLLSPIMTLFNLPAEAATSVVLGSIRKDGIAIGLLTPGGGVKIPISNPAQVLTVVYLAGVLLPCLVTLFTVIREMNPKFTIQLVARQMGTAIVFSLLIAWVGYLIF